MYTLNYAYKSKEKINPRAACRKNARKTTSHYRNISRSLSAWFVVFSYKVVHFFVLTIVPVFISVVVPILFLSFLFFRSSCFVLSCVGQDKRDAWNIEYDFAYKGVSTAGLPRDGELVPYTPSSADGSRDTPRGGLCKEGVLL